MRLPWKPTVNCVARTSFTVPDGAIFAPEDTPEADPVSLHTFKDLPSVEPRNGGNRTITIQNGSLLLVRNPFLRGVQDDPKGRRFDLTVMHSCSPKTFLKDIDRANRISPCGTYRYNSLHVDARCRTVIAASAEKGDKAW